MLHAFCYSQCSENKQSIPAVWWEKNNLVLLVYFSPFRKFPETLLFVPNGSQAQPEMAPEKRTVFSWEDGEYSSSSLPSVKAPALHLDPWGVPPLPHLQEDAGCLWHEWNVCRRGKISKPWRDLQARVTLPGDCALHSVTQVLETPGSRKPNMKHDIQSCLPRSAHEHSWVAELGLKSD